MIPPVSPCARVVDFSRSCQRGFWRFYPSRPDLLTPGYTFFADKDAQAIQGPHPFGTAAWDKDGMLYPPFEVGQDFYAGVQWYDGEQPEPLPPDQQIFPTSSFGNNFSVLPTPLEERNGFDARCYIIIQDGVPIDVESFFIPDVTDCCWQRVVAQLLFLLTDSVPDSLTVFDTAVHQLWGADANIFITPLDTSEDRWAWIDLPQFQVLMRVGTQFWSELFVEVWHGLQPPAMFGDLGTSPDWFNEATLMIQRLNGLGWNPDKQVTFIGHSKGAAILWLLARRMIDVAPQRHLDVLTLGCPKVGNANAILDHSFAHVRHVIHRQDVVPLLPPGSSINPFLVALINLAQRDAIQLWVNFPLYQITGDGWGNGMEQASILPWQTYFAWLQLLLQGQNPEPIEQHYLSSYVAALADCCNAPQFPFTVELWETLFGVPDNGAGGEMIGGVGTIRGFVGSGGIRLLGSGTILGDPGGLMLDGVGVLVYSHGITGTGGIEIGGEGTGGASLAGAGGLEVGGTGEFSVAGDGGVELGGSGAPGLVGVGGVEVGGAGVGGSTLVGVRGIKLDGAGQGGSALVGAGGIEIGGAGSAGPVGTGGIEVGGAGFETYNVYKQSANSPSGAVFTNKTLAFPSNVTSGSLLVLCMTGIYTGTITVSDNINGTWTLDDSQNISGGNGLRLYYFKNAAAGATTINVHVAVNAIASFVIAEYAAFNVSTVAGATVKATGTSASANAGALTSPAGGLVVAFAANIAANVGHNWTSVNAGFIIRENVASGSSMPLCVADKCLTAGSDNPTIVNQSAASNWGMIVSAWLK